MRRTVQKKLLQEILAYILGGYAQVDFNLNDREGTIHNNGKLDVHKLVTFFGYNFNEKASFV